VNDRIYISAGVLVSVVAVLAGAVGFFGGRMTAAQQTPISVADVSEAVDVGLTRFTAEANRTAQEAAAANAGQAELRSIIPSVESYFADNNTYAGMTLAILQSTYDQALDTSKYQLASATASTYCVEATSGGKTYFKAGPAATIAEGSCT
jgi:hypothetical protein